VTKFVPAEVDEVMRALNYIPDLEETKTMEYTKSIIRGNGIDKTIRVDSDLRIAQQGAQPSPMSHFDHLEKHEY